MFSNTIDKKKQIVDPNGNTIVDLTTSIFAPTVTASDTYNVKRLTDAHVMRPDKASFAEYGNTDSTEFILKYSGISNPFTINEDDILVFPEENLVKGQMADLAEDVIENKTEQIRNYYKFSNKDFKSSKNSYKALEDLEIPSGIPEDNEGEYSVPYISDDGTAAITIRNGRMYFGEDNATAATNMDAKIQELINSTVTSLQDKCALNGLSLTDFVRASIRQD